MATPLLQKARQRKMIYFGAIVVLFTLSLIHREFVVKAQATRLQLRETSRGEVELTSSAVRLMLTGSRGLAVTMLWYTATDKQKRSEWNELELIVKSITKLQPYFITPWLFQSWNLSFNVAVECDRPRDKYYYISRGLELLAEGERRNSGTADKGGSSDPDRFVSPGNPELRHFMGFIYQLKLGTSDENLTMRSLLELSCIDPIQRDPGRFDKGKGQIDLEELARFCDKYPRLIRRLHDQLDYSNPQRIVQFLQDHQEIPNRFKPTDKAKRGIIRQSELKDPLDQFPILPPHEGRWPNPQLYDLTTEVVDVFLVCRTWYEYAQKPLPPLDETPDLMPRDYDKLRYRVPKGMVIQLFRQYPARAEAYIAETLESEGFFDSDGWNMSDLFKKWSNRRDAGASVHIYGTEPKYHSRLAWQRAFELYKDFGRKNGIYIAPGDLKELNDQAEGIRAKEKIASGPLPQFKPEWDENLRKSAEAHQRLYISDYFRTLTNFDTFFYQAEAESDPVTVMLRKKLFVAERKRKREVASESTLDLYAEAWQLYLHACFKYPRFAQVPSMQEEFYEIYQRSLGEMHRNFPKNFKNAAILTAKVAYWPAPDWTGSLVQFAVVSYKETSKRDDDIQEMTKVFPMRKRYGPLDRVQYYAGEGAKEAKEMLLVVSQVGSQTAGTAIDPTLAIPSGREHFLLTRSTPFLEDVVPDNWRALISSSTRTTTGSRLGLELDR